MGGNRDVTWNGWEYRVNCRNGLGEQTVARWESVTEPEWKSGMAGNIVTIWNGWEYRRRAVLVSWNG